MKTNPYTPVTDTGDENRDRFKVLFAAASWLTAIIAIVLAVTSIYSALTNYLVMRDAGGSLPTYIPLVHFLGICCSVGFAFSAMQWRQRKMRRAIVLCLLSTTAVILGPVVLLTLLYPDAAFSVW